MSRPVRSTRVAQPNYIAPLSATPPQQQRNELNNDHTTDAEEHDQDADMIDVDDADASAATTKRTNKKTGTKKSNFASAATHSSSNNSSTNQSLLHTQPLNLTRAQLYARTEKLMKWRDDEEEEGGEEKKDAGIQVQQQQLDTTCLASLLHTLPPSLIQSFYSIELSLDSSSSDSSSSHNSDALETAREIMNFMKYGDGEVEVKEWIRVVREWSRLERDEGSEASSNDLWSLLRTSHIPLRNITTFCYLLLSRPSSLTSFLASAFYLSLLEYATLTKQTGLIQQHLMNNDLTMREVQNLVRKWTRRECRRKETGVERKRVSSSSTTAASKKKSSSDSMSDDPFASDLTTNEEDDSWLDAPESIQYIEDYLAMCEKLYATSSQQQPLLPLFKYAELFSHCVETLVDITRTDVEVSGKRGGQLTTQSAALTSSTQRTISHSFTLLLSLLHPLHNSLTTTYTTLLKHMLQSILLCYSSGSGSTASTSVTIPKHLVGVHRGAVVFVKRMVSKLLTTASESGSVVSSTSQSKSHLKSTSIQIGLYHFLQHLLIRASDRAEYRRIIAAVVMKEFLVDVDGSDGDGDNTSTTTSTSTFLSSLRTSLLSFLTRMCSHKRAAIRLMAVELLEVGLTQEWILESLVTTSSSGSVKNGSKKKLSEFEQKMQDAVSEEEKSNINTSFDLSTSLLHDTSFDALPTTSVNLPHAASLLTLLLRRCSDSSPVVRAKALGALAHVLQHASEVWCVKSTGTEKKKKKQYQQAEAWRRCMREREMVHASASHAQQQEQEMMKNVSAPLNTSKSQLHEITTSAPPVTLQEQFNFLRTPLSSRTRPSFGGGGDNNHTNNPNDSTINLSLTSSGFALPSTTSSFHPSLSGVRDILCILYKRAGDEKAVVRKAAIQVMECVLVGAAAEEEESNVDEDSKMQDDDEDNTQQQRLNTTTSTHSSNVLTSLTASDLQIFYDGCSDKSLSIRKQAAVSLSLLVRQLMSGGSGSKKGKKNESFIDTQDSTLSTLQLIWLGSVLPLIQDHEKSVADKALEFVEELMMRPMRLAVKEIVKGRAKSGTPPSSSSPSQSIWSFFSQMNTESLHYFRIAFVQLLKRGSNSGNSGSSSSDAAGVVEASFIKDLLKVGEMSTTCESASLLSSHSSTMTRLTWLMLDCTSYYSSYVPNVDMTKSVMVCWRGYLELMNNKKSTVHQLDSSSLLHLHSTIGNLALAGKWKQAEMGEFITYLVETLMKQVHDGDVKRKSSPIETSLAQPPPELIKKQIWILNSFLAAYRHASEKKKDKDISAMDIKQYDEWEKDLLTVCEKQLEAFITYANTNASSSSSSSTISSSSSQQLWNEPLLQTILFTIGETVLQHQSFNPKNTLSQKLVMFVQVLMQKEMVLMKKQSGSTAAAAAGGMMSDDTLNTSQVSPAITSTTSTSTTSTSTLRLSSPLRAHAYLTLGKMCLRSEQLAKRSIMLFISELESANSGSSSNASSAAIIHNNILLILCDLCRTYTSVIDPYISSITNLLCSENVLLRKHTILVLNVLLGEEYLKMKSTTTRHTKGEEDTEMSVSSSASSSSSSMFYRYLRCLVDDDSSIRTLVQVSLKGIMSKSSATSSTSSKASAHESGISSNRIHMHFIELIYFLNQCEEHPVYNQFRSASGNNSSTSRDSRFSLTGPLGSPNSLKRYTLYKYCLSLLTDEQKFILISKIHSDILQVVNEDGFITKPWFNGVRTRDVIQDGLVILASEEMQLSVMKKGGGKAGNGDMDTVEGELAELALVEESGDSSSSSAAPSSRLRLNQLATLHAQSLAKSKLLYKLLKKSTVESCLPVLIELRNQFVLATAATSSTAAVSSTSTQSQIPLTSLTSYLNHYFLRLLSSYSTSSSSNSGDTTSSSAPSDLFSSHSNQLQQKEIMFDLKRWEKQMDEMEAEKGEQVRKKWIKMDFTPERTKEQQQRKSGRGSNMLNGISVAPDSVVRRASFGSVPASASASAAAAPHANNMHSTPLKVSSLGALRIVTPISSKQQQQQQPHNPAMQTPLATGISAAMKRSYSTPSNQHLTTSFVPQATPQTLRTPGRIMTPALKRTSSTPVKQLAAIGGVQARRRSAPMTPARLVEGDEDVSDDDEEQANHSSLIDSIVIDDTNTDAEDENDNENDVGVLIDDDENIASATTSSSSRAAPIAAKAPKWNISVCGTTIQDEESEEQQEIKPQAKKKARTQEKSKGATSSSSSSLTLPPTSSLSALSLVPMMQSKAKANSTKGNNKRKHASSPQKSKPAADEVEEEEQENMSDRANTKTTTAAATKISTRAQRKTAGLR